MIIVDSEKNKATYRLFTNKTWKKKTDYLLKSYLEDDKLSKQEIDGLL